MPSGSQSPEPRRRLGEPERRAQIIRGCVEVLARDGYQGASLARVAEAAGVSKGLVSHYFGDRNGLMGQTAHATLDHLRGEVAASTDLTLSVPEILRASIHYASGLAESHAPEMRALDEIVRNLLDEDGVQVLNLSAYEETYLAQEELLRRGQEEGTIGDLDTRVAVVTYQAAIDSMIAYLKGHPDADPTGYADALADLLIRALEA